MMKMKKISLIIFAFVFILPLQLQAATLYMDPVNKRIGLDDVFEVKVKIGVTGGKECINVAKIGLSFSTDVLEMQSFNSGESIFSLWIDKPDKDSLEEINKEGKIYFTGGVPGGYCGKIPGDPGDSNILGTVVFSVKKPVVFHKTNVDFLLDSKVLLNDGEGGLAKIKTQNASFEIDENKSADENIWEKKIIKDITLPEPFVIEIKKIENVFDNQYFVIFHTTDKQTGIDHFEVLESNYLDVLESLKEDDFFMSFIKGVLKIQKKSIFWEKTDSPHLLKDQSLESVIMVKAIDNAGNERIVEYQNDALNKLQNSKKSYTYIFILISLMLVFLVIIFIIINRRKKDKDNF